MHQGCAERVHSDHGMRHLGDHSGHTSGGSHHGSRGECSPLADELVHDVGDVEVVGARTTGTEAVLTRVNAILFEKSTEVSKLTRAKLKMTFEVLDHIGSDGGEMPTTLVEVRFSALAATQAGRVDMVPQLGAVARNLLHDN